MKEENKEILKKLRIGSFIFAIILIIIAIISFIFEGNNPVGRMFIVIALSGFCLIALNISKVLKSE